MVVVVVLFLEAAVVVVEEEVEVVAAQTWEWTAKVAPRIFLDLWVTSALYFKT